MAHYFHHLCGVACAVFQDVVQYACRSAGKLGFCRYQYFGDIPRFILTFILGIIGTRGHIAEATVQGLAGAYGNIGYMGPAIAILALGERAAIPVAIFCFENILHFALAPALLAVSGDKKQSAGALIAEIIGKILFHPFIIATVLGVGFAILGLKAPAPFERLIEYLAQAAAPCALFAMGVTLAL